MKECILILVLKLWCVGHCFKVFFIECKWVSTLASTHIGLRKPSINTLEEISRVHLWRILNLRLDNLVSLSLRINRYLSLILNLNLMIHLRILNELIDVKFFNILLFFFIRLSIFKSKESRLLSFSKSCSFRSSFWNCCPLSSIPRIISN